MKMIHAKKALLLTFSVFLLNFLFVYAKNKPVDILVNSVSVEVSNIGEEENVKPDSKSLYNTLNLELLGLSHEAFEQGMAGYKFLLASGKINNGEVLTIADFSKPSCKKRLFVIDVKNGKLLFNTYVAHGRNSGREVATTFSNDAESFKSSLGFFVTGDTYTGKHGFSLRLIGEEKGINDNANSRAIVMHSAAYVSEVAIKMQGYAGRSLGCPALPLEMNKPIIEKIKNGSCLYLYSPDRYYAAHSTVLKKLV